MLGVLQADSAGAKAGGLSIAGSIEMGGIHRRGMESVSMLGEGGAGVAGSMPEASGMRSSNGQILTCPSPSLLLHHAATYQFGQQPLRQFGAASMLGVGVGVGGVGVMAGKLAGVESISAEEDALRQGRKLHKPSDDSARSARALSIGQDEELPVGVGRAGSVLFVGAAAVGGAVGGAVGAAGGDAGAGCLGGVGRNAVSALDDHCADRM
jgi:hypothetical protein